MQCEFVNIVLVRHAMEQVSVQVLPHEIPILQAIHGEDNVDVNGKTGIMREVDAGEEYERLVRRYGEGEDGQPVVHAVYGHMREGRIQTAMDSGSQMVAGMSDDDPVEATQLPAEKKTAPAKLDSSENKYVSKKEIVARLKALGVKGARGKKGELTEQLLLLTGDLLMFAEVDFEPGDVQELSALLDAVMSEYDSDEYDSLVDEYNAAE